MGPYERLFRIMGGLVGTLPAGANHVALHVPGAPPRSDTMPDARAAGLRLAERAARGFPPWMVAGAVAHLRADAAFMACFRATEPLDEAGDLWAVAVAMLAIVAAHDRHDEAE